MTEQELIYLVLFAIGAVVGYVTRGRWDQVKSGPVALPPEVCLRDLAHRGDILDKEGRLNEIVSELTGSHAKLVDLRGDVASRYANEHGPGKSSRNYEKAPRTDVEHVLQAADEELSHAINRLAVTPVRLPFPRSEW